jgi:presenilin-like A22 family membrane protease
MMIGVGIAYTAALDGHALFVLCAVLSVVALGLYEAINIYNKV